LSIHTYPSGKKINLKDCIGNWLGGEENFDGAGKRKKGKGTTWEYLPRKENRNRAIKLLVFGWESEKKKRKGQLKARWGARSPQIKRQGREAWGGDCRNQKGDTKEEGNKRTPS